MVGGFFVPPPVRAQDSNLVGGKLPCSRVRSALHAPPLRENTEGINMTMHHYLITEMFRAAARRREGITHLLVSASSEQEAVALFKAKGYAPVKYYVWELPPVADEPTIHNEPEKWTIC
jgi:hypothetical protein